MVAGLADWDLFSGHSGRVGMAQNGAPTHEIERQGRWKQGGGMVGRYTAARPQGRRSDTFHDSLNGTSRRPTVPLVRSFTLHRSAPLPSEMSQHHTQRCSRKSTTSREVNVEPSLNFLVLKLGDCCHHEIQ